MSKDAFKILEYLLAQVAAESYLDQEYRSLRKNYVYGANRESAYSLLDSLGELGATQATSLMWTDFSSKWSIIAHQENTTSGFSGTLLKNISGEYTISFRSTESNGESKGGDVDRDSFKGANGEISATGFAWGQILDMEKFLSDLTTSTSRHYSAQFDAYVTGGGKLNVTGYSLGGHLAQVFTQLHRDVVLHTYTFNGAGIGTINAVPEGASIKSELTALLVKFESILSTPSASLPLLTESMLNEAAASVGHLFLGPPELQPQPAEKLDWIIQDSARWYASETSDSSIYTNALYQLAVAVVEKDTSGVWWQGLLDLNPFSTDRHETPDPLITNVYGRASTGDQELVAISGQRFGSPLEVFIEDQANSNDVELIDSLFDSDRSVQDDLAALAGDTHSITLIIDSLYTADLLQRIDPQLELGTILGEILPSSSNDTAASIVANDPDDVEANAIENVVNALGKFYLPESWALAAQDQADNEFAEIEYRDKTLHKKISELRVGIEEHAVSGSTSIEVLTETSLQDMLSIAKQDDSERSRGYRYALANLLPFAIVSNLTSTAADSAEYDLDNTSNQYLYDRALMLTKMLEMNVENEQHGDLAALTKFTDLTGNADGVIEFDGDSSGYSLLDIRSPESYDSERERYVFGSDADETPAEIVASNNPDHLYGMGGNDSIDGLEGGDSLEGGFGNDRLTGGTGDDYLIGGPGEDQFHWSDGDGHDTIGDYDDGGDRIIINGYNLANTTFERVSADSVFFRDINNVDITAHYDDAFLTINIGSGPDAGSILVTQYTPATGRDYGITLNDYPVPVAPVKGITDFTVAVLGSGSGELRADAYDRQRFSQGGLDWSAITIHFDAQSVVNYSGGIFHGTWDGAFNGGPIADYLHGDADGNALHGLAGNDFLSGGSGDDLLEGGSGSDLLVGGDGDDLLFGSTRRDVTAALASGSAYEQFYALQALDTPADINTLEGGSGNDMIGGGEFTDLIDGGLGVDYLLGGTGGDRISGGEGSDVVYGDSRLNYRYSEPSPGQAAERLEVAYADGSDSVGLYNDVIIGGAGDDALWGELGNDAVYGGDGNDYLMGDRHHEAPNVGAVMPPFGDTLPTLEAALHGNDRLYGQAGSDVLLGHGGDDTLAGGTGTDTLAGGVGNDTYVHAAGDGLDYIDDGEGIHTVLFLEVTPNELEIYFQGGQVLVGTEGGQEGFYFSSEQWADTRIAIGSADALVERSAFNTHFANAMGQVVLTVLGSPNVTEAERDDLFVVDNTNAERPSVVFSGATVRAELETQRTGAVMRVAGEGVDIGLVLSSTQISAGLGFLNLNDTMTLGLEGFTRGTNADDTIIGREYGESLFGNYGNDTLYGLGGDDDLYGGPGSDTLIGGTGNDTLTGEGIFGNTYLFSVGDGQDIVVGGISHTLGFSAEVQPKDVRLYWTGSDDTQYRVEYSSTDTITAEGGRSANYLDLEVDGVSIPVRQHSDLLDGFFHDTHNDDIFITGNGNDTVYLRGAGTDIINLSAGDGLDTVEVKDYGDPSHIAQIRFGADVDPSSISFRFSNADTTITYGNGDQVTLNTDWLFTHTDNIVSRFTVVSEADPSWFPVIEGYPSAVRLHGTVGADHILGDENINFIYPGFGDDIVDAGTGPDLIDMTHVYISKIDGGIGAKTITAGPGSDVIKAPLYQGLTFNYSAGDGHDTIEYDWSYSNDHPYLFDVDRAAGTVQFTPHGEDVLSFAEGIALSDLSFERSQNTLLISMKAALDSIRIDNFFQAYGLQPSTDSTAAYAAFTASSNGPASLTQPGIPNLLPAVPVAYLEFADGSRHDLSTVLEQHLEDLQITHLGTLDADLLEGSAGDDVIRGLTGDDTISDSGGSNVITGGEGDDEIQLLNSDNIIHFGRGSGADRLIFDPHSGSTYVQLGAGITSDDIEIHLVPSELEDLITITLIGTGDVLTVAAVRLNDPELGWEGGYQYEQEATLAEIRFTDGTVITEQAILEMTFAASDPNAPNRIEGTSGNDLLVGTSGNDLIIGQMGDDILKGKYGDDVFLVEGTDQGVDRVNGGAGSDMISGGEGDDRIALSKLVANDSIEIIDGREGHNTIVGTDAANTLDFTYTYIRNIAALHGRAGNDKIFGSSEPDIIVGGEGDDFLKGGAGDDIFVVEGSDQGIDRIRGGDGFDTILGGAGDDSIGLLSYRPKYAVERIDGGLGTNTIVGTSARNVLNFSSTELLNIAQIEGGGGNDLLSGSRADDVLVGGAGNDVLRGNRGNDVYRFGLGDGNDRIQNNDGDRSSFDELQFNGIEYDALWLSRDENSLRIDVVGSNDGVSIEGWYDKNSDQLDSFSTGSHTLMRSEVDLLVSAMAAFAVPEGIDVTIPDDTRLQLDAALVGAWQPAA